VGGRGGGGGGDLFYTTTAPHHTHSLSYTERSESTSRVLKNVYIYRNIIHVLKNASYCIYYILKIAVPAEDTPPPVHCLYSLSLLLIEYGSK